MVDVYDEGVLLRRVSGLDRSSKAAFAAACAERMWPLVERYASAAGIPSEKVKSLRTALDAVWRCVSGEAQDVANVQVLAESMIPEEDDQWVFESGYGQNAIAAVAYAARTWLTDQPHEAVWAARQLYEAAEYAAQSQVVGAATFSPEVEDSMRQAPVVRAALSALNADLETATRGSLLEAREQSYVGAVALAALFT